MTLSRPRVLVASLALGALVSLVACGKKESRAGGDESAASASLGGLVETHAQGSILWDIDAEGVVRADLRDLDDAHVSKNAKGTIEWKENDEPKRAKLEYDADAKVLLAHGPAPTAEITELRYVVVQGDAPVQGTLHVPAGGTASLAAQGDVKASPTLEGTGPHGGLVQVVGGDRVEIVADDDSDEVRVYVLDAEGKAIVAGDRKITIAVVAETPRVIVFAPAPGGLYFVANAKIVADPTRVTIVVRRGGKVRVAIVGWKPGAKLVVAGGPKVKLKAKGNGGKVDVKIKDGPGAPAMIKVDIKDHGNKKVKIKIK